ncbi:MAG: hypothetical protein ACFFBH_01165 [Promethearchaeota archaeon]
MEKKRIAILLIICMSFSAIPLGLFGFVVAKPAVSYPDYQAVDWQSGLAGDINMPDIADTTFKTSMAQPHTAAAPEVGDVVYDWYLSAIQDNPYMTLRAIVGNAEVWVANDLSYPDGDPRNADIFNLNITDAMCEYLAAQFNDVIYPADTNYFGMPEDRDGTNTIFEQIDGTSFPPYTYDWINATDNPQRTIIKVFNIQDANYYDPTYPYFVIGFFSSGYDNYYNRNMIHIDCWQWWRRVGDLGQSWFPDYPDKVVEEGHAHDYESTIAHEYQHLIHHDWNPNDDAFMNEGCSMYAEFVTGYGIADNYFNSYFATPDNSLTIWGDQGDINILADYGVAALWTMYLSDHYGGADIIRDFVQAGIPGIDGINAALADRGYKRSNFYTVYHDWRLANLIRASHGKYGYDNVDFTNLDPIRIYDVSGLPVPSTSGAQGFGSTHTILDYDTGVSMLGPFGSDYIQFSDWNKPGWFYFNGDDQAYLGWQPIADGFWSAFGDEQDKSLTGEAFVDPANPTLELITKYSIEPYWDFGFIQAFNETSGEWVSLANEYTTYDHDPSAYPAIVAELPGLTGQSPGWASDEWTTMEFDLSYWAGQTVQLNFRYMTDWSTTAAGWYINQASVSGTPVALTYESGAADFMVTVVQVIHTRWFNLYLPWDLKLNDATNTGLFLGIAHKHFDFIVVVSPTMLTGFTDYSFQAQKLKWHCH